MKIGIIGLPQAGKKTIFKLLTGLDLKDADPEKLKAPIHGIATVRDPRFDKIESIYSPDKKTPAHIEVVLMPKVDIDYIRSGNLFEHLADADAVCHIVRAFRDEAIYHVDGSVDAVRDIDSINAELILADLVFVEKRMERLNKETRKKGDKKQIEDEALLLRFKEHLEKELPLRLLEITEEEKKIISSYPFLTTKPLLIALNAGEDDLKRPVLPEGIVQKHRSQDIYAIQISAKIENELACLDSREEKELFLNELGIDEPAVDKLTRLLYEALGLISFFTAANKEVRAWTIKKGSTAPEAAGAVHSDMQRGFIRAEVIKYDDLVNLGSEHRAKEAGKLMIKGKDYIVCDGDILNIRFNV